MITEVQSEVVNSPEEYQSRLDEIEKQHKLKVEERSEMQEAIQDKKQSIKQITEKLNFVQKIIGDFHILADIYEEQKYCFIYIYLYYIYIQQLFYKS